MADTRDLRIKKDVIEDKGPAAPRGNLLLHRGVTEFGELLHEGCVLPHIKIAAKYRRNVRGGQPVGDQVALPWENGAARAQHEKGQQVHVVQLDIAPVDPG